MDRDLQETFLDAEIMRSAKTALSVPMKMRLMVVELIFTGMSKDLALARFSSLWDHVETNRKQVEEKIRAEAGLGTKEDVG